MTAGNGQPRNVNIAWIVGALAVCSVFAACVPAYAADSEAVQKTFEGSGAPCHKLQSYAGKSDADLETKIHGIIGLTTQQPKTLSLTDADVADVAAYISSDEQR
jgi:hypothetical protein